LISLVLIIINIIVLIISYFFFFDCQKGGGATIKTTLPYIRNDIPIVVVFRALGIIPDKDILEHICYDRNDTAMFEMLKPCLEDSFPIQEQEVSCSLTM
jgi:DNA-directed RNA polymerase II subunit RPB2